MDPISDTQLEMLRSSLETLAEELSNSIAASSEEAQPVDLDQPIGRLSRADALQQQSMAAANRSAALRRRQQVVAALERIRDGEYGACQSCGEEIGLRRLQARPEAPFCIECQGRREQRR